jgi:hypothetical protein
MPQKIRETGSLVSIEKVNVRALAVVEKVVRPAWEHIHEPKAWEHGSYSALAGSSSCRGIVYNMWCEVYKECPTYPR